MSDGNLQVDRTDTLGQADGVLDVLPAAPLTPPAPPVPGPPVTRPRYVYAIGAIEPRFPGLAIEKEFAQATGRAATAGLTDRQAVQAVLADPANRYLARKLCWVLTIEGQDHYLLVPRDGTDLDMLIGAIRPTPRQDDVDVVIGTAGALAPPEACNGLIVPTLVFDQVYSFDPDSFLAAIPRPESLNEEQFRAAAGASDEHRALNYLAVRYPAIYGLATERFAANASLTSVEVVPSRLSGLRALVNVVFTFTHRQTGVAEKSSVRVDVTEEFPFLVGTLSPYYDR